MSICTKAGQERAALYLFLDGLKGKGEPISM